MKTYLKIKLKHLTAEARINRNEQEKLRRKAAFARLRVMDRGETYREGFLRARIREHLVDAIRPEARASYLAYGFLRGRSYDQIETKRYTEPNWVKVFDIVNFFNTYANTELVASPMRKYNISERGVYYEERDLAQRFEEWKQGAPTLTPFPTKRVVRQRKNNPEMAVEAVTGYDQL